jgi:hypothetical protein
MAKTKKVTSKINSGAVMEEVKKLALLGGGVVLGSLGGKLIDNVLKVDTGIPGFNPKALVRPAVLVGAGTAGVLMLKDNNLKLIATGVGASGVLSGVKTFMKKDLLNGLADFSGLGEANPTDVYREPINLSIERYNPDLPALNASSASSVSNVTNDDYRSSNQMIEGNDDGAELAYIEII